MQLSKIMQTNNLLTQTSDSVCSSPLSWSEFLSFSSRFYKYNHTNALLIYAQNPNATACASFELWNQTMLRKIKRGSKGIAIFDTSKTFETLQYVFDVADTTPYQNSPNKSFALWSVKPHHEAVVIQELQNHFGDVEDTDGFVPNLMAIVRYAVEDNYIDYFDKLTHVDIGQKFENLSDVEARAKFLSIVTSSVSWIVLSRLGIDPANFISTDRFSALSDFDSMNLHTVIGTCCHDISSGLLRQVERTVKAYDKEHSTLKGSLQNKKEAVNHGEQQQLGLYEGRGGIDTESGDAESASDDFVRDVGKASEGLSGEASTGIVGDPQNGRDVEPTPVGDRDGGHGDDRPTDETVAGSSGSERDDAAARDERVGGDDGQLPAGGVRERHERTDLSGRELGLDQLSLFPTETEQDVIIQKAIDTNQPNVLDIPQSVIDDVILHVSEGGKDRIYCIFATLPKAKEKIDCLKGVFGIGGRSISFPNNGHGFVSYNSQGITIKDWSTNDSNFLSWSMISKRVDELISAGRFLPNDLSLLPDPLNLTVEPDDAATDELDHSEPIASPILVEPENRVESEPASVSIESAAGEDGIASAERESKAVRIDFRITDDNLGVGGAKTKYHRNIAAIRLLKSIEADNRNATAEEQEILSQYVGFGSLPQAFDADNKQWTNEFAELKDVLSESEYTAARASTLNAHYTSPIIIKAIYQAIENLGFKGGNILEPSCGIGNFMGLLPEQLTRKSNFFGVEIDSITGRICAQLYQNAHIDVKGFESTDYPDSFFDICVGNVPFGSYTLPDKRYDKHSFLIHDYFFAKSLDKVRSGGIVAFITSKGTLDKQNPQIRKYIAQRAEFLGAIRLPNNAFSANAGTEVTADIIFLKKRDRAIDVEESWTYLDRTADGISVNSYFVDHPEMMLGKMAHEDRMYGNASDTTCVPFENADLPELLNNAIQNIRGRYEEAVLDEKSDEVESIPADISVRNFSYTIVDGDVYFRDNSRMYKTNVPLTAEHRIRNLIGLRDCMRKLIDHQLADSDDATIRMQQERLTVLYDSFVERYGRINDTANGRAFSDDSSYYLLCSLEILNEDREFVRKADMFSKRTIRTHTVFSFVDTPSEALAVSISEKAHVDLDYMADLCGHDKESIVKALNGVIFQDPTNLKWVTSDEYLSGNVRQKLQIALEKAKADSSFQVNVDSLLAVQPTDLTATEVDIRLGATFLEPNVIQEFITHLLQPVGWESSIVNVKYAPVTGSWFIENKSSADRRNIRTFTTYGTSRMSAYAIIEDTLNLNDVRVTDPVEDSNGKVHLVLNKNETAAAREKQEMIREEFKDWLFNDPNRREKILRQYNDLYNSIRTRQFDGRHIQFSGINPEITLRPHQVNAVARIIYGGNTLLAHEVGAGKTYTMTAAAMESKRLGLCNKSMFVVPNHLVSEWGTSFLRLYPSANILVATEKDFETGNRKKFCARIATGDYDAVIIGHSQFEKIPVSAARQISVLQAEIDEIIDAIQTAKEERGERYQIKQMEKTRRSLEARLKKLNDTGRKDDVVTFEELGIDRLFVDEAHNYKNLFLYTKMRNVAGISQNEAQKSSDLYMKCRYLDELTGNRGICFATGTPISNTMAELYTMQRYLQYHLLVRLGLKHFDSWASTFGETKSVLELAPEGVGYRMKTRFSRFYNLPELMSIFREVADIQTSEMLNLPVPKLVGGKAQNVLVEPSEFQENIVQELAQRAERVRSKSVDSKTDNMLQITNDGRKVALDQRLFNILAGDDPNSKVNACVKDTFDIWEKTKEKKLTQVIFCDLSTPSKDSFNLYDDIKSKLIAMGVPPEEIAFIHDAKTNAQKTALFSKVRKGTVRVLLGSTAKCGAGTNVQDKLVAERHLDVPWRPSDILQREGRILRQGNENEEVMIVRYITQRTFEAYCWQIIENKLKFINQIMSGNSSIRFMDDISDFALSVAEAKALATGNPLIIERFELENEVNRLMTLKTSYRSARFKLEDRLVKEFPSLIKSTEDQIAGFKTDINMRDTHAVAKGDFAGMTLNGIFYPKKDDAGLALLNLCKTHKTAEPQRVGNYRGFDLWLNYSSFENAFFISLKNSLRHITKLSDDVFGNITRIENTLNGFEDGLAKQLSSLTNLHDQVENAKIELEKPFRHEDDLALKSKRFAEITALLSQDKKDEIAAEIDVDDDIEVEADEVTTEDHKSPEPEHTR